MKTVLISGAERNIGLEMTKKFLEKGWKVYAGQFRKNLPYLDLLFNGLRPKGFTIRMYCKDKNASADKIGAYAADQFVRDRAYRKEWEDRKDQMAPYKLTDENRFVLRDWMGRELPW